MNVMEISSADDISDASFHSGAVDPKMFHVVPLVGAYPFQTLLFSMVVAYPDLDKNVNAYAERVIGMKLNRPIGGEASVGPSSFVLTTEVL